MPSTGITIGIGGWGETSAKNAVALLKDHLDAHVGDSKVTLLLAITPDDEGDLSPAVTAIGKWLLGNDDYDFEIAVPSTGKIQNELRDDLAQCARRIIKSADQSTTVARNSTRLFIAFDEEDPEAMDMLLAADRFEVPAFDLTNGLLPLVFEEEEDEADAPEAVEKPIPEPEVETADWLETLEAPESPAVVEDESDVADEAPEPAEAPQEAGEEPSEGEAPQGEAVDPVARVRAALQAAVQYHMHMDGGAAAIDLTDVQPSPLTILLVEGLAAFEEHLVPKRKTPGRPRKDGTPAQPRERDADGNPIRRRAPRERVGEY